MIGALLALAGTYAVRYKQSSDCTPVTPPPFTLPSRVTGCGHGGSSAVAARSPGHASGFCGAFQRNAPTGGLANGTPRKIFTPSLLSPTNTPVSMVAFTGAASA